MATPFTLAVVVLLVGLAVTVGGALAQLSQLKETQKEHGIRLTERERHAGETDKSLASFGATLKKVDENVEKLLSAERRSTA